jgi:hemoglobin
MSSVTAFRRSMLIVIPVFGLAGCIQLTNALPKKEAVPAWPTWLGGDEPAVAVPQSLYERLGGKLAITAVVDGFLGNVAADDRINRYFARTNVAHLRTELIEQFCAGTGGPCTYEGRSMKDAHKGLGVTSGAYDALIQDLVKAMNQLDVPQGDQDALLALVAPMRADIVERG